MNRIALVLLFLGLMPLNLLAQDPINDSIPSNAIYRQDSIIGFRELKEPENTEVIEMVLEDHEPNKAAWYSAAIPGLGQAYNKKYWKIPVVWAGIAGFAYFINWNNDQYQYFRKNLIYETEQNPDFPNETPLEASTLKSGRDQYRRTRDMLVIFSVLFYMLNIVDAHVDAHLIEFDVNQSLSVQVMPSIQTNPANKLSTGLTFSVKF